MSDRQPDANASKEELLEKIRQLQEQIVELEAFQRASLLIEERLEESEERFRFVTEYAQDGILTFDLAGVIIFANQSACNMLGYPDGLRGVDVHTLLPETEQEFIREQLRAIEPPAEGQNLTMHNLMGKRVQTVGLKKCGTTFPVEIAFSSYTSRQGRIFAAFIRDDTERKKLEQVRSDVQRLIRHDLKSPLIGIGGFAKYLKNSQHLQDKEHKWAMLIYELAVKMTDIINKTADFERMEDENYVVRRDSVDIEEVARNMFVELSPLAREKSIVFILPPYSGSAVVQGETMLLEDLFSNLLKNAVEASPGKGTVTVTLSPDSKSVHIDIHNHGVIAEDIRHNFFERYVTNGKQGGTGLGTWSAQLITRAHHGTITFTTSKKEGTHLLVRLPKKQPSFIKAGPTC